MNVSREIQLNEYLIAGTDPDIIALYEGLPVRAQELQFGLVEDEVVIVDTETTGLNPSSCSLIEIAAIRMRGGDVIDKFHTFVNPGKKVPEEITELTGITQEDVEDAPSPAEAVRMFADFADTCDLVAHNAEFDRGFIMRQAQPGMLPGAWVDTLALSQIALPRFKTHRLVDLARAFNLHTPTHSAMDDTQALGQLWRILLAALQSMTPGLAGRIAEISPETNWALRPYFEQAALQYPGIDFSLRRNRAERTQANIPAPRADADEVSLAFFDEANIEDAFSETGVVGAMYPQYEQREEQVAMACEVAASLREGDIRIIEAGTGVGKSMAYLLPLALAARENNITTGVATKTNALMDQLVYHELPRLKEAVGDLNYVALKGYEHYLCLRKLDNLARATLEDGAVISMVAALMNYSAQTSQGDLDTININWAKLPRADIQANPHDCLKKRCPFFPRLCFLHGARKSAGSADIVVTNHALLFRDMQTDNGILPPIRHWVIDEAHSVESEARRQLSSSVSSRELELTLHRLTGHKSGITARVRKRVDKLEGGDMLYGVTADIETRVGQIQSTALAFFDLLDKLETAGSNRGNAYSRDTTWISQGLRDEEGWVELCGPGAQLADSLTSLNKRVADLVSMLEQFEGEFASQIAELSTIQSELLDTTEALKLILDGSDTRFVYSLQRNNSPRFSSQTLEALRLDIGESLLVDLYPHVRSIIFTSATLSTADENPFDYFMHATGVDRVSDKKIYTARFASGYDYDHNMTVLLPSDLPEPTNPHYRDEFARLLYEVHTAMGGSVLTLFTNRREMESLYKELKPKLADVGIGLVAQTYGTSTKNLRDRFLADESLSMFALKSFWEGFDAPGDTLRCVIIARLPFGRPDDPVMLEHKMREGGASWKKYALPEAIMDLKQAAGRLIRNSTDSGWLILADSRLQTKGYGKSFLRAMPTTDIRTLSIDEIARLIEVSSPGQL